MRHLSARLGALLLLAAAGVALASPVAGPRRTLLSSSCPTGVQISGICAPLSLNFQTQQYWVQGQGLVPLSTLTSWSRASNELCAYSDGSLISVGSNTPCITDQGAQILEARTNRNTNFSAAPTATTNVSAGGDGNAVLSVVDDSAAMTGVLRRLKAQGTLNGNVYKLDCTTCVGAAYIQFGGTTGSTSAFVAYAYLRGSGTTSLEIQAAGGSVTPATTLTSSYARYTGSEASPGSGYVLKASISAGGTLYAILNGLEQSTFVLPPVVVAGSTAARAADIIALTGQAATKALAAKAAFFQTNGVAGGTLPRMFAFDAGAASINFGSSTQVQILSTGTATATIGGSGTWSDVVKTAAAFDSSSITVLANGGSKASSANAWLGGTTAYLGNRSVGDRALNGFMQRFALSPIKGIFDQATKP